MNTKRSLRAVSPLSLLIFRFVFCFFVSRQATTISVSFLVLFLLVPLQKQKETALEQTKLEILEATERLALTLIFRLHVAVVSFSPRIPISQSPLSFFPSIPRSFLFSVRSQPFCLNRRTHF